MANHKRDRSEDNGDSGALDSQAHARKRMKSKSKKPRDSMRRSLSVEGGGAVNTPESPAHTPKGRKRNKRHSTGSKKIGKTPDTERPESYAYQQPAHSEQTPSKKRKIPDGASELRVDSGNQSPGKVAKKKKPRRKSAAVQESRLAEGMQVRDDVEATTESVEAIQDSDLEKDAAEARRARGDGAVVSPPSGITNEPKEKKPVIRRQSRLGLQPWNEGKHVVMSRDILRIARSMNLDPKIRRALRQGLQMQKETKTAFKKFVNETSYSWKPDTAWDAEKSEAICKDIVQFAERSDLEPKVRRAMLDTQEAFQNAQLAFQTTKTEFDAQQGPGQPEIEDVLSETATIKGHVKLAQETLRNTIQQGRNIRVRHIHDGHWKLYSKQYVQTWAKVKDTQKWQTPLLLFRRSDCQLSNGQRAHRCHVAGILIGEEELETHCLQIPKHASLDPVVAATQEGRYIEGNEDSCHIDIVFFGHGCLKLRMPRRLIERPLLGDAAEMSKGMVDFYGVQVAHSEE
ncbi:hypothetical protein K505DRAFT_325248 [Melanomma pulvis-pyrius CBS 109.77]|uniref:Uncharacterized protein n=1 Tax=Melanomma pulvis-pyrius CBS 109.77 TaxID=1314802 RepID=A0A6A6XC66_9PLEO|nr:hypothetical protein K505DRAFT_325248 [Melanomma pulvis-pyrius CBS 109.77]